MECFELRFRACWVGVAGDTPAARWPHWEPGRSHPKRCWSRNWPQVVPTSGTAAGSGCRAEQLQPSQGSQTAAFHTPSNVYFYMNQARRHRKVSAASATRNQTPTHEKHSTRGWSSDTGPGSTAFPWVGLRAGSWCWSACAERSKAARRNSRGSFPARCNRSNGDFVCSPGKAREKEQVP